ncbi:MAG: PKD domain-containing protein [Chitinophagaceae bacterium]|nr:PKD domain-containing protein [Chitinophagaceae bacterium]
MKKFLLACIAIFCMVSYKVQSQDIIQVCCDDTICEPGIDVHLTAVTDSSYYGDLLSILDDTHSQLIDLGFSFTFFGNTYTKCVLSTNAYITFDSTKALQYSPWTIANPIPSPLNPMNAIMGPWHDVDPSVITDPCVSYGKFGEAPNRYFIYNFTEVPMYSTVCNALTFTGQMILYETTNNIDIYLGHKVLCPTWNNGYAIEGLHNEDGTVAVVVPGRNYPEQWEVEDEGIRFTPNGNSYDMTDIPYQTIPFAAGLPQWYDAAGNFLGSGSEITVNPEFTTSYYAKISSCFDVADTVTIVVDTLNGTYSQVDPSCPTSGDGSIAASTTGNFGPSTFVWLDSNGDTLKVTGNADADDLDLLDGGQYIVIIVNSIGCFITHTYSIGPPPFSAGFSVSPSVLCADAPVFFTDLSVGTIGSYFWSLGDGTTSTQQNPMHSYVAGTYKVQLIVTAGGGCADTFEQQIVVQPNIVVGFSIQDPPYCVGSPIQFTDNSSANPSSWSWDFGDGGTSDVQNPSHSYGNPGNYDIHVAIADAFCGEGESAASITVNFVPDPKLREDTLLCPNEPLVLDADADGTSYAWSTGENTESILIAAPESSTYYSVVVDNYGCKGTDSVLITPDCLLLLPAAFSPNSDGVNDLLHPLGSLLADYSLTIFNRWGQEVYAYIGNDLHVGWNGTYEGKPQPIGVYVYVLKGSFVSGEAVSKTGNVTVLR